MTASPSLRAIVFQVLGRGPSTASCIYAALGIAGERVSYPEVVAGLGEMVRTGEIDRTECGGVFVYHVRSGDVEPRPGADEVFLEGKGLSERSPIKSQRLPT